MSHGSSVSRILLLLGAIFIIAIPFGVHAKEAYLYATVSEILETESEDCLYFIAKGDFEPDGKQGRELSICLDNDNDAERDMSLAIDSYEQQKEVYILIDEDSVRRIDTIDTLSVRNGVLKIVGESWNKKLIFDGEVIRDEEDYLLSFVDKFSINNSDVVLIENILGGTACPAQYFFVSVSVQGNARLSQEFGNCSDLAEAYQTGEKIVVVLPSEKGTITYEYDNGKVVENRKDDSPFRESTEEKIYSSKPPIRLEVSKNPNSIKVKMYSLLDEIVISDVAVNRRNCEKGDFYINNIKKNQLPKTLLFAESFELYFDCEKALQVDVIVNGSTWTWQYF